MGLFKKRKSIDGGTIDLSDMQRRGIIKKKIITEKKTAEIKQNTNSEGYTDFTNNNNNDTMDFFSSLSSSINSDSGSGSSHVSNNTGSAELGMINKRMEDLEYKMENFTRKLNQIIDRMEVAEKRLDRIEGRGPY